MARIVEGIKELLKGKDDDDYEYRYRRDQRGSKKYSGYPTNASPKGRSGYPTEGRSGYPTEGRSGYPAEGRSGYPAEGRSGYPAEVRSGYPAEGRGSYAGIATVDGRSGYATNSIPAGRSQYPADGRSGYPVTATADVSSGYAANSTSEVRSSYPTEGRSAYASEGRSPYPSEGRSPYPSAEGRSGYPVSASTDGRSAYSADHLTEGRSTYSTEGREGYLADGRSGGYPVSATADGHDAYPVSATVDGRGGYPVSTTADGRGGYSVSATADGRGGYPVSATADGRSGYPANGSAGGYRMPPRRPAMDDSYVRSSYDTRSEARGEYRQPYATSPRESEYSQSYGIRDASPRADSKYRTSPHVDIPPRSEYVRTTQLSPRELASNPVEGSTPNSMKMSSPSGYYETVARTGILAPPPESISRGSPSGRRVLARMPSFGSGKVTHYDGVDPYGQDYEAKDYTGFRRMPSFGKSRHHEAEYISNYDERSEPWASSYREFNAPIRRMPSFNRSRYHDAEYMAADDDRDYTPRSFYDNGSYYTASYNDRPSLLSQVSFSKIPVENPNYVKQIANF